MVNRFWKFWTSLKLTVVLLGLCTLLVFLGTLAQVHEGLWEAQGRWFRSFWVWRRAGDVWWVPWCFPGGYTLGFGLLFNLIAAHLKRFRLSWNKVGINLTHLGIILLLVGQLLTDLLSRESFLSFAEGETRQYSESHREVELVVATPAGEASAAGGEGRERVFSFDGSRLFQGAPSLRHPELPVELRILQYGENAEVFSRASVLEAWGRLTAALVALEAKYGSVEAVVAEAGEVASNEGRARVWKEALQAAGGGFSVGAEGNWVDAARQVLADPKREGVFREDLKRRFRSQMLAAFGRASQMEDMPSDQARAMAYVAQEFQAGRLEGAPDAQKLPVLASQGVADKVLLVPKPAGRGMDDRNVPYAVVEVREQGGQTSLGTWLVSPWLEVGQEWNTGGRSYRVALRMRRYAQPFALTLLKTTHEKYQGTNIPKNFQSRVLLENPQTKERREVDIFMNNPLRYGGLTFYQSQMGRTEAKGGKGTSVLQVVRNPGWITPYLGCAVVSLGMVWQFLFHLVGFLARRSGARSPSGGGSGTTAGAGERELPSGEGVPRT
jgi:hypothetical protein